MCVCVCLFVSVVGADGEQIEEMSLLVWKRRFWEKVRHGLSSISMSCTSQWASQVPTVWRPKLSDTHCPFITVSDLIINLLHIGLHPQATPFFFKLFYYQDFLFHNCQFINQTYTSSLAFHFCSKGSIQTGDEESLPKGQWPAFFWAEQQSQFAKGTQKWGTLL